MDGVGTPASDEITEELAWLVKFGTLDSARKVVCGGALPCDGVKAEGPKKLSKFS